jgi:SAM-dependent methyltransferase
MLKGANRMSETHYQRIADLYDSFVKSEVDVPFFTAEARKAGGDILELMAGTGRLTLPLVEAGIKVTAVDFSAAMLDVLRQKLAARGLQAETHHMDVRTMQLGRQFRQIILPFQAFPELTKEADQKQALQRIHDHLTVDGVFICTLHNPPVRLKSVDNHLRLAARQSLENGNQLHVWLLQRYDPQTLVVDVLEFFEEYDAQGVMQVKRFSELQFHLLHQDVFERLIAETGFKVVDLYGDYTRAPFDPERSPFMIWVLRRK